MNFSIYYYFALVGWGSCTYVFSKLELIIRVKVDGG